MSQAVRINSIISQDYLEMSPKTAFLNISERSDRYNSIISKDYLDIFHIPPC